MPKLPTPLERLKAIEKEFNLGAVSPKTDVKLAFIQAQIEEMKQMVWRETVNILHAQRLIDSNNEVISSKGSTNLVDHRNTVKMASEGVLMLMALQKELEAEG